MEILKRSLSAFLALILVVGMVPVPASASEIAIESAVAETAAVEVPAAEAEVPETVPVTTAPAQTVPETTAPAETVPETTAPAETVPETTAPAETVPETTAPAETVPETTAPAETVPETTAPEETVPETTEPQETEPAETVAEETASEEAVNAVTASGLCGDDLSWVYDEDSRTLTISGSGEMYDFEWRDGASSANWSAFASQIRSVVLGEEVGSLGSYAFAGCTALANVVMNEELSSIGEGAFAYCTGLNYLRIPGSVGEVGAQAFRGSFTAVSEQIRFEGDVPSFEEDTFVGVTAMIRYPFSCDASWIEAVTAVETGSLVFKPYNDDEYITQETLQQWIEQDETELVIDGDAFLEESFTLPEGVSVTVESGCSLSVYYGTTLTVNGSLTVDGGTLTVYEGGALAVNGTLENRNDGYVQVAGTYTKGEDSQIRNVYEDGAYGNFTGIPAADQTLIVNVLSSDDFIGGLEYLQEQDFPVCEMEILGQVYVSDTLTVPANCTVSITDGCLYVEDKLIVSGTLLVEDSQEVSLSVSGTLEVSGTVESSGILENTGAVVIKNGGHVSSDLAGTVRNDGQISVNPGGAFEVDYNWYGTEPVNNGGTVGGDVFAMNSALLQRRAAEFFAQGEDYVLWRPFSADASLTVPQGETLIARGTVTVPEGVTMTVNCDFVSYIESDEEEAVFVSVEEGGHLILGEDARMTISGCNAEIYGTLTNNGTVDDDTDEKALVVYGTANNNGVLSGNMDIYGQVINRGTLYNMCPDAECYVTLRQGGSLVNEGNIHTQSMVLTVETGGTLTNNSVIGNEMGTIRIDGRYVHADDAYLYQVVTEDGIGTITGIPLDEQTLYAEISEEDDFGTIVSNLTNEMEDGYPQGRIYVFGGENTLSDSVTIPANVVMNLECESVVLDGCLTIEGGMVYVSEDTALTNNGGMELFQDGILDNEGRITSENSIDIAEGGCLYNAGSLVNNSDISVNEGGALNNEGQLTNAGTITVNMEGMLYNEDSMRNTETGVIDIYEDGDFINRGVLTNGMWVDPEDPENVLQGEINIDGTMAVYGTVYNEGLATVRETGLLYIYGDWGGDAPINEGGTIIGGDAAPISQEALEELLAESVDMEEPYYLNTMAILESNFTVPAGAVLVVEEGGSFEMPRGITFTVNGTLVLTAGGQLEIPEGSRLTNAGTIILGTTHEDNGHLYVEGSYTHRSRALILADYNTDSVDTVTGIDEKYITLECYAEAESTLTRCLELTARDGYAGARIISTVGAYFENHTIAKNVSMTLVSPFEDEIYTVTFNGKITINGTVTVAEDVAIVLEEGGITVNKTGVLNLYGTLAAPNEEDGYTKLPVNNGGRIYPVVSDIYLECDGSDVTGDTIILDSQTLEEGYLVVQVVAETDDDTYYAQPLVKWASDKSSIVNASDITYHGNGLYRVPIKENGIGTVKLTATAIDGSKKTAYVSISVCYVDPAKKLTATTTVPTVGLQQGDTAQIRVFGDAEIDTEYLEFTSSNEDILIVDEDGVITGGEKTGTANVVAAIKDDPLKRKVSVSVKVIAPQTRQLNLTHDLPGQASETAVRLDLADLEDESYTFTIYPEAYDKDGIMELTGKSLKWTSSNTKLATVRALSSGEAEVTIKAKADGVALITAETTDLAKLKASVSLTVMDYSPRLGSTSLTLNPAKEESAKVSLIPSYGNEILDVYFENDELPLYASYEEGMLTIYATDEIRNGTINAKLVVLCERETDDGDYKETEYIFNLKLTVRKSLPAVTLKQNEAFRLFYTDSEVQLAATAKDAVITDMWMESDTFDLTYDADTGVATVTCGYLDSMADASTRATVYVEFEGYQEVLEKNITISTNKTKPSIAADPSSSSINTRLSGDYKAYFHILNKTTKTNMAVTEQDVYGEYLDSVSEDGLICLDFGSRFNGTASVDVQLDNWLEPITVTHRVKMSDAMPKAKLDDSTVKLNTNLTGSEVAEIGVSLAANVRITRFLGLNQNSSTVNLEYDADRGVLLASLRRGYTGTYKFELTPCVTNAAGQEIRLDPVKLTVQAKQGNVTVSLKSSGKLDTLDANSTITYTVTKINNAEGRITNVTLTGEDSDMFQLTPLAVDAKGNQTFQLKLIEEKRTAQGYDTRDTYQVRFVYTICGRAVTAPSATKIRVTQSKLSLSAPAVTFYQSQDLPLQVMLTSSAAISRIGIDASSTSEEIVKAYQGASMVMHDNRKTAEVHLTLNPSHLVAGKTYKLVLNVYPIGQTSNSGATKITVNVKVAK